MEKTKETETKVLWLYWHGKKEKMKYLWAVLRITKSRADCVYSVFLLSIKTLPSPKIYYFALSSFHFKTNVNSIRWRFDYTRSFL